MSPVALLAFIKHLEYVSTNEKRRIKRTNAIVESGTLFNHISRTYSVSIRTGKDRKYKRKYENFDVKHDKKISLLVLFSPLLFIICGVIDVVSI